MRWVGRRALGIVGLFIHYEINQRVTTDEDVAGHPDLDGRLSVAPGSMSGTVEISKTGEDGAERELGKLFMDPGGDLRELSGDGPVLGRVDPQTRTITPTPEGEAWLQRRAGEAGITLAPPGPDAGGQPGTPAAPQAAPSPAAPPRTGTPGLPQAPEPGQEPQRPAWMDELNGIETRDDDERRFIEGLAMGGAKHDEIVSALNERRRQGGAAPSGAPPVGTARPPVSAGPHSPPGPPYPGPDVTPMDRQERALVQRLLDQGKGEDDVRRTLTEQRARVGPEREEKMRKAASRNGSLPPELSTDWMRYPENAIDADPAVQTGELTRGGNPRLKVDKDDFVVHHLWAMKTVRNHQALFAAAARAGWNPDEGDNTFIAAKNKDGQRRMEKAMGERRPVHDNGHNNGPDSWNATNDADAQGIEKQLEGIPPGPEYDQRARRLIEEQQKVLRERAKRLDRITMLPGAATTTEAV